MPSICIVGPLALLIVSLLAGSARAATHCVAPGGAGGCFDSVQGAVDAAASGDTVSVAPGTYAGDLTVTKRLTIAGAGADVTTLLASSISFRTVTVDGPTARLVLRDVTLQGNLVSTGVHAARRARVHLQDCVIRENGTALYDEVNGGFTVERCSLVDNGIAVALRSSGARLVMRRSTVANSGMLSADVGRFRIEDSTFSDNVVQPNLPRSFVIGEGAKGIVERTTFFGNTVDLIGGVADSFGAGGVRVRQSIVEGCLPRVATAAELYRKSIGYNVLVSASCPDPHPRDIVVADPLLGPLADNGGPTETRAPQPGSPALGGGIRCRAADQRGVPRAAPCDIGAVEVP
jgi:hypothetical protein